MSASNYPPGVTGNEPEINPVDEFETVWDTIARECVTHGLSDMDADCAWKLGLAAWLEAHKRGAVWPHEQMP
jgi:hypothetical protein